MSFEPTPRQTLLLFGLLAKHGACKQADLMPKIEAKDREALVKARLIKADTSKRPYGLVLADAGWAWAAVNLATELSPTQRALSDMLKRLGDHLVRSGATLADFIGSKPEDLVEARKRKIEAEKLQAAENKKQASLERKTASDKMAPVKSKEPTATSARRRIETAYLAITGQKKNVSVKLSRLRIELGDLDRGTVDAALARVLAGDKQGGAKASLMRNDDPRQLDEADHAAAFNPNGEPFHMIWIAS